jgi:hypothetical protein
MQLKLSCAIVALAFSALAFSETPLQPNAKASTPLANDTPESGNLFNELIRLDAELFDAAFVSCDQKKYESFFTNDVEFYHDLAGAKFGDAVKKLGPCPADKGLSRILNQASVEVFPVEGYGAIQTRRHTFVQKGSKTIEVAQFVHLWRSTEKGWKLARVMSFGHEQQSPE